MGIQDPLNKQNTTYYVGNVPLVKSKLDLAVQKPVDSQIDNHTTRIAHDHGRNPAEVFNKGYEDEGMHSHPGHPERHPVRLRHRKGSADPLHKEEDSLVDEWKDLYDKAMRGECTPNELKRLTEIRGRVDELNASRATDAERILGIAMKAIRKAEGTLAGNGRVVESSPKKNELKMETSDESWRNRDVEYGDPDIDDGKIIPENNGYKDQVERSESVWGTPPKNKELANVFFPDNVKDAPVKKADVSPEKAKKILRDDSVKGHPLTEKQKGFFGARAGGAPDKSDKAVLRKAIDLSGAVAVLLEQEWSTLGKDDGRYSDPTFYQRYVDAGVAKHDLPGSPHWQHMTNGGGWGVKVNPETGNFVAYQNKRGNMSKRAAQTEAVARNKANKEERDNNDKQMHNKQMNNNLPYNPLKVNAHPLTKDPRSLPPQGAR